MSCKWGKVTGPTGATGPTGPAGSDALVEIIQVTSTRDANVLDSGNFPSGKSIGWGRNFYAAMILVDLRAAASGFSALSMFFNGDTNAARYHNFLAATGADANTAEILSGDLSDSYWTRFWFWAFPTYERFSTPQWLTRFESFLFEAAGGFGSGIRGTDLHSWQVGDPIARVQFQQSTAGVSLLTGSRVSVWGIKRTAFD